MHVDELIEQSPLAFGSRSITRWEALLTLDANTDHCLASGLYKVYRGG
jgi:hypothetical protein